MKTRETKICGKCGLSYYMQYTECPICGAPRYYAPPIDVVNHPAHYAETVPGIECKDVIKHFSYFRGAAIKYLWRAGKKDKSKEIEDLRKAIKCIEIDLEDLTNVHTEK